MRNLTAYILIKYRARVLNTKQFAPTTEQEQILALTAHIEKLKLPRKAPTSRSTKTTATRAKRRKKEKKWGWKKVMPTDSKPTAKAFEGKHY